MRQLIQSYKTGEMEVAEVPPPAVRTGGAVVRTHDDTHTVPSKIYEAMASGRPVLVSADGAPAKIMGEARAGLATPAADSEALAASIRALASDRERCRSLGEEGRRYAARFDRHRLVERFEEVLRSVARRGRG